MHGSKLRRLLRGRDRGERVRLEGPEEVEGKVKLQVNAQGPEKRLYPLLLKDAAPKWVKMVQQNRLSPGAVNRIAQTLGTAIGPRGPERHIAHLGAGNMNIADRIVTNQGPGIVGDLVRKIPLREIQAPNLEKHYQPLVDISKKLEAQAPGSTVPYLKATNRGVYQEYDRGPRVKDWEAKAQGNAGRLEDIGVSDLRDRVNESLVNKAQFGPSGRAFDYLVPGLENTAAGLPSRGLQPAGFDRRFLGDSYNRQGELVPVDPNYLNAARKNWLGPAAAPAEPATPAAPAPAAPAAAAPAVTALLAPGLPATAPTLAPRTAVPLTTLPLTAGPPPPTPQPPPPLSPSTSSSPASFAEYQRQQQLQQSSSPTFLERYGPAAGIAGAGALGTGLAANYFLNRPTPAEKEGSLYSLLLFKEAAAAPPGPPPNYRPAVAEVNKCATCKHFVGPMSHCKMYKTSVAADYVCDSWEGKRQMMAFSAPELPPPPDFMGAAAPGTGGEAKFAFLVNKCSILKKALAQALPRHEGLNHEQRLYKLGRPRLSPWAAQALAALPELVGGQP